MRYVYVLDVTIENDTRSNRKVYNLVNQLQIPEDNIFIDTEGEKRTERSRLLSIATSGDQIIIRSLMDFGPDLKELYRTILPAMQEDGIELFSCEEPFLCGTDYSTILNKILLLIYHFRIEKRKSGFEQAVSEGRVGRPAKADSDIEEAIKLYNLKSLTLQQIEKLTGVSKSTLYRYIRENKEV